MTYLPIFLALAGAAIANPVPQGVTAAIAPPAAAPAGCLPSYSGTFGVAVLNSTGSGTATQGSDGQTNAGNGSPVTQIGDGQAQGGVVSQIGDGQVQGPATATPINQIGDGQVQAQPTPISQIGDGQIQNVPVSQIGDGQVQNVPPASQIGDGQVQSGSTVSQAGDGQTTTSGVGMVACQAADSLQLTLNNGILLDNQGRTGYIASNYQFQFDKPAQAGAIYTAGFSVCGNGSLALGGSAQWWQCKSGDFYNLYDRWWAAQCSPVTINVVKLISC